MGQSISFDHFELFLYHSVHLDVLLVAEHTPYIITDSLKPCDSSSFLALVLLKRLPCDLSYVYE